MEVDIARGEVVVTLANGANLDRKAAERAVTVEGVGTERIVGVSSGSNRG